MDRTGGLSGDRSTEYGGGCFFGRNGHGRGVLELDDSASTSS